MSDARSLLLHIGHTKTGSSFLQSALELSRSTLADAGVDYPAARPADAAAAREGRTASGNGLFFCGKGRTPPEISKSATKVLFSSEMLFEGVQWDRIEQVRDGLGFERLRVLVFIREPLSHLESLYQQLVKRSGETGDIALFAKSYQAPSRVRAWIERIAADPGADITVLNYDLRRKTLLPDFVDWLGAPRSAVTPGPVGVVNRSMTRSELEFQRLLNMRLGASGQVLSDPLCDRLPEIAPDRVPISAALASEVMARLADDMAWIDERTPAADRYAAGLTARVSSSDAPAHASFVFTREQLEVAADAIAAEILTLRARTRSPIKEGLKNARRALKKAFGGR